MTALVKTAKPTELADSSIPRVSGRYTVMPDVASLWLDHADNPRPVYMPDVTAYARDMVRGQWLENGESIKWSDDPEPKLIDGEHRLRACILAGIPFVTWVVVGVPRQAVVTIDMGRKRGKGQQLRILAGERYANHLASVSTLVWRWNQGPRVLLDQSLKATMHDVLDTLKANPGIRGSVEVVHGSFAKTTRLSKSATVPCFIHFMGARTQGEEKATAFIEQLHFGSNIGPGDPAYTLREKLVELSGAKDRLRIHQHEMLALWIPAWNAFAEGRTLRRIAPVDWTTPDGVAIV